MSKNVTCWSVSFLQQWDIQLKSLTRWDFPIKQTIQIHKRFRPVAARHPTPTHNYEHEHGSDDRNDRWIEIPELSSVLKLKALCIGISKLTTNRKQYLCALLTISFMGKTEFSLYLVYKGLIIYIYIYEPTPWPSCIKVFIDQ